MNYNPELNRIRSCTNQLKLNVSENDEQFAEKNKVTAIISGDFQTRGLRHQAGDPLAGYGDRQVSVGACEQIEGMT